MGNSYLRQTDHNNAVNNSVNNAANIEALAQRMEEGLHKDIKDMLGQVLERQMQANAKLDEIIAAVKKPASPAENQASLPIMTIITE